MHIQLIICHPHPESFTHALASQVEQALSANQHQVTVHDLYQEKFDPVLTYEELVGHILPPLVGQHIQELTSADGIIIIHPNWWGKPPAILAGWIDRVIRMNAAYTFPKGAEGGAPIGLLKLQKAVVFTTANTSPEREKQVFGDPLENIWKNCVFQFCGVEQVIRRTFTVVVDSSLEERKGWLQEAYQLILNSFPAAQQ